MPNTQDLRVMPHLPTCWQIATKLYKWRRAETVALGLTGLTITHGDLIAPVPRESSEKRGCVNAFFFIWPDTIGVKWVGFFAWRLEKTLESIQTPGPR